jgi:hypothetical protein
MAEIPVSPEENKPRGSDNWAAHSKIKVSDVPSGATNINVEGKELVSPMQGFGQLWQKTYRVRLPNLELTAAQVMQIWKEHFPEFQPEGNHFYPSMVGIKPGEVLFIDSSLPIVPKSPGLIPIASGVMVLYVDEESFTVMTPQGFPESGWNTFSVYEEEGVLVAQVQSMARATDPVYEFGFRFMGGASFQENTWREVLSTLAAHFGAAPDVEMRKVVVDQRVQWSEAKNIWHNAGIRTILYKMGAPLRWLRDQFQSLLKRR